MKKRVFVGLSGGVDSSVSAALLKRAGHECTGVFLRIWQPAFLACTWKEDRLDAMRVAASLGIPFREIDLSEEYEREVVGEMVRGYERGITPNPDVLCNERIKFGAFLRWALAEGADAVATGHYARVERQGDTHALLRGIDPGKDQSYFLYRLGQEELSRTLFPVGGMEKRAVRALARSLELPVARKPDSQGLCFAGDISIPEFLARYIRVTPGNVLDTDGAIIGRHDGAGLYTVGQRHGFSVAGERARAPQYVIAVDTAENTITVSPSRDLAAKKSASLVDTHWIGEQPAEGAVLSVQTRYHERPVTATLSQGGGRVDFSERHIIAPGQSLVWYDGETCLGGGIMAFSG